MKIRSSIPRKQRRFLYSAPLHLRHKIMAAHLSKELIKKLKRRNLPVRRGDEVEIMRGKFKGKHGKIAKIDTKRYRVYIEGITIKKTDRTERQAPIHPSKLRIINLNLDDKERVRVLERKGVTYGKDKKTTGTEVLESAKEDNKVGSQTQSGASSKV